MKDSICIIKDYIIKPKGNFIWRDIPGYEGRYQMSNHGDIRNVYNQVLKFVGSSTTLISNDGTRRQVSWRKAVQYYFAPHERFKGNEKWVSMEGEFYGRYEISNYGEIKKVKKTVLHPNKKAGTVVLVKYRGGKPYRETISIVKIFLNTFPPYEVSINEKEKVITYNKHGKPETHSKGVLELDNQKRNETHEKAPCDL